MGARANTLSLIPATINDRWFKRYNRLMNLKYFAVSYRLHFTW